MADENKTPTGTRTPATPVITPQISREERERLAGLFFSKWSMVIRNICGAASVGVMLYIAYLDAITTRISIEKGSGWPNDWHFFIYTIGPTIASLSFLNANKTISTILSVSSIKDKAQAIFSKKTNGVVPMPQANPDEVPQSENQTK